MVDPDGRLDVQAGTAVVVVVAVILIAVQAGVVAYATGFGPFDQGASGSEPVAAPESTGSGGSTSGGAGGSGGGSGSSGGSGSGGGSGGSPAPPPYDFDVLGTEQCGNTCREVTVRLTNNRNETAESVVVSTSIYSGNTTDESARVWDGRREVGTLESGESTTATERVSLSYFEALSVKRKGGWITIVTTVESAKVTKTFRERRKVA